MPLMTGWKLKINMVSVNVNTWNKNEVRVDVLIKEAMQVTMRLLQKMIDAISILRIT